MGSLSPLLKIIFITLMSLVTALGRPSKDSFQEIVFPENRRASSQLRIIGGQPVTPHSYPFTVALFIQKSQTSTDLNFCGGTLLTNEWVLTAAHCVDPKPFLISAVLGLHNLSDLAKAEVIRVNYSVIHEDWNEDLLQNDIALLKLVRKATLGTNVTTVKLANGSDSYTGQTATTIGWGLTENNSMSYVLKSVQSPVISNQICNASYGVVVASHLCVSGEGTKGSCNGDSGGPLLINNVQIGIVSFGATNCTASHPSAFTRITSFNKWIAANLRGSANIKMLSNISLLLLIFPFFGVFL